MRAHRAAHPPRLRDEPRPGGRRASRRVDCFLLAPDDAARASLEPGDVVARQARRPRHARRDRARLRPARGARGARADRAQPVAHASARPRQAGDGGSARSVRGPASADGRPPEGRRATAVAVPVRAQAALRKLGPRRRPLRRRADLPSRARDLSPAPVVRDVRRGRAATRAAARPRPAAGRRGRLGDRGDQARREARASGGRTSRSARRASRSSPRLTPSTWRWRRPRRSAATSSASTSFRSRPDATSCSR